MYVTLNGKGSSNWLWSTGAQSCFLLFNFLAGQSDVCIVLYAVSVHFNLAVEDHTKHELQDLHGFKTIFLTCLFVVLHYAYQHMPCLVATVDCSHVYHVVHFTKICTYCCYFDCIHVESSTVFLRTG